MPARDTGEARLHGNWPVSSSRLIAVAVHESIDKQAHRSVPRQRCSSTERLERWRGAAEVVTSSTTDRGDAAEEVREPPRCLVRLKLL